MSKIGPAALAAAVALISSTPREAAAQTVDWSRLTMGVSVGRIGRNDLWSISSQPIVSSFEPVPDTFAFSRSVSPAFTVSAHGTVFVRPTLGITGELTYLGLGTESACSLRFDNGDPSTKAAYQSLNGDHVAVGATSVQIGVVLRPWYRSTIQPFGELLIGAVTTPVSSVDVTAHYGDEVLTVYHDYGWQSVRPTATVGGGLATAPNHGMQLRVELRFTWLTQSQVTAATATQGAQPMTRSATLVFPSLFVGFDIVLKRQRGQRY